MTDNMMPELTLEPTAAAEAVPQLTLEPTAPEVPEPEEKKIEPVEICLLYTSDAADEL